MRHMKKDVSHFYKVTVIHFEPVVSVGLQTSLFNVIFMPHLNQFI